MRYFVTSNDDARREQWVTTLAEQGFDVVDEYDPDAVIVTLGGDGTLLYAARRFPDPTILPVRTSGSEGYKTHLDSDQLIAALEAVESREQEDAYVVTEHPTVAAYREGEQLRGEFDAVNEIGLHHSSATRAAVLAMRVTDRGERWAFDRIIGDGVLVATPFGSTAYYRSITGGTVAEGLGIAFNNVHTPADAPEYLQVSGEAVVEVELLGSDHASGAVLTRDNDDPYELAVGETVEIRQTDATVEILRPLAVGR